MDVLSNGTADPCDNYHAHVCGRSRENLSDLQRASVYYIINNTLRDTEPAMFPEDVRSMVYYFTSCFRVLNSSAVDNDEIQAFKKHIDLSLDTLLSEDATDLIDRLVRLAIVKNTVPAMSIMWKGPKHAAISPGDRLVDRLAPAIAEGNMSAILSSLFNVTVCEVDLAGVLALDEPGHGRNSSAPDNGWVPESVQALFSRTSKWLASLFKFKPALVDGRGVTVDVAGASTIKLRVNRLESASTTQLSLYYILCAATNVILAESGKQKRNKGGNDGTIPAQLCLSELRQHYNKNSWNRLVWYSIQPWNLEGQVREVFYAVKRQLLVIVEQGEVTQKRQKMMDSLRRVSLALPELVDNGMNSTVGEDSDGFYYVMQDQLLSDSRRRRRMTYPERDIAETNVEYYFGASHLHLMLGVMVPPLFRPDYTKVRNTFNQARI